MKAMDAATAESRESTELAVICSLLDLEEFEVVQVEQDRAKRLRTLPRRQRRASPLPPAVGLVTACVLWICLGDVRQYGSAAAYRKAMGLNLKERSSGQHKGKLSLSKRGQRLARKWLYFSALRW